jgi:RNA polymerase I-specific transcription initiation factor RRN3
MSRLSFSYFHHSPSFCCSDCTPSRGTLLYLMEKIQDEIPAGNAEYSDFAPDGGYSYTPCENIDWAVLPKPILPISLDYEPIEKFVSESVKSISSRELSPNSEAFKSSISGYKSILEAFRKKDDPILIKNILLALRTGGNGSTLNDIISETKRHSNLLHHIFRLDSIEMNTNEGQTPFGTYTKTTDFGLMDAHLNLLVALVSANSVFLTPTLNTMWRCIENTDAITPMDKQLVMNRKYLDSTDCDVNDILEDQHKRNSRLHGTLRKILQLVPKGHSEIFPVIASSFPFKLAPLEKQVAYVKQAFTVLSYVPTIHQELIELCIDKCLEIDVEIRIAQDGAVNIEENDDEGDLFDFEKDPEIKDDEKESQKKEESEKFKNQKGQDQVSEMAEKLDTLMYLTFDHLHSSIKNGVKTARQLYKMVIAAFDSVILTTHRSKFTQFLILFLCGLDNNQSIVDRNKGSSYEETSEQSMLAREFAAKLIELVLDPYRPTITRQSAACYLASFVSRSNFVCAGTACEAVSAVLRFAEAYMETYPTEASTRKLMRSASSDATNNGKSSKLTVHTLFYTVCQTAFYIMCFRGKECTKYYNDAVAYYDKIDEEDIGDDHVFLFSDPQLIDIGMKRWTHLCSHHLHPLKYCLESVRGEFLLLADRFKLVEDALLGKLIIEDRKMASGSLNRAQVAPKKATAIQTAATLERRRLVEGVGGLGRGSNPLDSFFPFDPYLLRRSYKFINPFYRHWSGILSEEESDGDNDESAVEAEDDESITSDEESDHSDDESAELNDHLVYEHDDESECVAMSLTSTATASLVSERKEGEDEVEEDDKVTAEDMKIPRETWVNELKRARALSVEDCW